MSTKKSKQNKSKSKKLNINKSKKLGNIVNIVKHIFIKNNAGFGNKVFDLIFAIYLYNLYNKNTKNICKIHYVLVKSTHDKYNDPTINTIFLKTKSKINFITESHYKKINNKDKIVVLQDLKNLSLFPKYENLSHYTEFSNNFKLVYEMYKTFSKQDKDSFTMNKNILTDKDTLNNITSQHYSLVHIRYGDKLYYLSKIINKPDINIKTLLDKENNNNPNPIDQFILYTPDYYIDKINELLESTPKNMSIYIITDSVSIVKKFIMSHTNFNTNSRIVLLDTMTWWDSFYLLYYASNIILSSSTFCFAGSYFNKKMAKCELLLYHHNKNSVNIAPEESAISPYWKIVSDRKYILNYNSKIAFEVLKFKYNWKY